MPLEQVTTTIESPLGPLTLCASEAGLCSVAWSDTSPGLEPTAEHAFLDDAVQQLMAYFSGERQVFDLPLDPDGTAFQKEVWAMLREIPYGTTTTYSTLAHRLGDLRKTRAVGMANGSNPLPIIVPCHRVIGADGSLTGFAGGLDRKAFLLRMERHVLGALDGVQANLFG